MRYLVHERFDHEHVVRVRDCAQRAGLHSPGGTLAVESADATVFDVVPMVAAADRPLIDIFFFGVPGVELQPVGPVFLTDGEARAHPTTADVVIHGYKLAVFQTSLKFVIGRRARETGRKRRTRGFG